MCSALGFSWSALASRTPPLSSVTLDTQDVWAAAGGLSSVPGSLLQTLCLPACRPYCSRPPQTLTGAQLWARLPCLACLLPWLSTRSRATGPPRTPSGLPRPPRSMTTSPTVCIWIVGILVTPWSEPLQAGTSRTFSSHSCFLPLLG